MRERGRREGGGRREKGGGRDIVKSSMLENEKRSFAPALPKRQLFQTKVLPYDFWLGLPAITN